MEKNIREELERIKSLFNEDNLYGNTSTEPINEGLKSTLKGIGGMFRGTGYSYTKYAYELSGALKELNEELEETLRPEFLNGGAEIIMFKDLSRLYIWKTKCVYNIFFIINIFFYFIYIFDC